MAKDILKNALADYEIAKDGWVNIYTKAREDLHFLSDEPDAQWIDERIKSSRNFRYTIDQLGQFIHQVSNDIRMNTPTINVIPDGNGADIETAKIFTGIIKGIEYKSNADAAYDTAVDFSIKSSIGYIRVDHRYVDEDSFEQELCIERVVNPLSVYIDPASIQSDGSDAMYGFVLEEMPIDEFERLYPNKTVSSFGDKEGVTRDNKEKTVTIAEYFKIVEEEKEIGMDKDGKAVPYTNQKKKRSIKTRKICRYKLSGADVLEETTFPGRYIPLVPVYGEEAWIDGERNLYSLIRKSKSSQMMYNLTKTLEVEVLMKQPQAPFIAAAGTVSGFEDEYADPSKVNVLHYNQTDVDGNPASAPQRSQPPVLPQGFAAMARESVDDIKATMGLYNASIGVQSNETSGIAIQRRQQEGDVATFHFGDNLVRSITQVGRIIVFAAPEIYDTARIIKIIGEEEQPKTVGINGEKEVDQERDFNLNEGKYDVRVITGASFTTQRQEAGAFYNQLIQSMPDLMPVIGDLVFKYQDTAGSQAISARLKKLIDPKLLDIEEREELEEANPVDPEKEQMAQAMQAMQAQIQQMQAELESKQVENQVKVAEVQIKQEEVGIKKDDLKLKYLTALQQPQQQSVESEKPAPVSMPMAMPDDSIEVLQARIQAKIMEQQALAEKAVTEQQEQAMELQQEAQEAEIKMAQTNAVIQALNGIQQQVANLTQTTMVNAEQTARLVENQDKPITITRDEFGNITGAV